MVSSLRSLYGRNILAPPLLSLLRGFCNYFVVVVVDIVVIFNDVQYSIVQYDDVSEKL